MTYHLFASHKNAIIDPAWTFQSVSRWMKWMRCLLIGTSVFHASTLSFGRIVWNEEPKEHIEDSQLSFCKYCQLLLGEQLETKPVMQYLLIKWKCWEIMIFNLHSSEKSKSKCSRALYLSWLLIFKLSQN